MGLHPPRESGSHPTDPVPEPAGKVSKGANLPVPRSLSDRQLSADSGPTCRHSRTGRFDLKQTHRRKVIRGNPFSI